MADQNFLSQVTGQSPNLLQSVQGGVNLQEHLVNLQMQKHQLAAREALGQILQESIDPKSNTIDYNKVIVRAAGNPATAWMAPDLLDKFVTRNLTQAETALKELDRVHRQQIAIYDMFAGLLPKGDKLAQEDVLKGLDNLRKTKEIDDNAFLVAKSQMAPSGPALFKQAKEFSLRAQGAAKSLETVFPAIQAQGYGGGTAFLQPKPTEGRMEAVGNLPHTLTPERAQELIEVLDVDGSLGGKPGQIVKIPRNELYSRPQGEIQSPAPGAPAAKGVEGKGAPPSPSPRYPVTGQSPQLGEAWKKLGSQFDNVANMSKANESVELALDTAEDLMKNYHPQAGAGVREKIANTLSALGIEGKMDGKSLPLVKGKDGEPLSIIDAIANGSLSKGQAFKSVMLDFAANRLRNTLQGGQITNMEFGTYQQTKPNPEMSEKAVRELIHYYRRGIALDRLWIKGYNYFLDNGRSPTDFTNWWEGKMKDLRETRRGK